MMFLMTGVGSGIGMATCLYALSHNHHVIGIVRNEEKASNLIRESNVLQGELSVIYADLSDDDFAQTVLLGLNKLSISKIDILVNIAGVLSVADVKDFELPSIENVLRVNFSSPSMLISKLIPFFRNSQKANILNISSMSGFQGSVRFPGLSIYGASKAALSSLSESLSVELSEFNIRINSLAIGAVDTEMLKAAFPEFKAPISSKEMAEYIYSFVTHGYLFYNGKTISVAVTNP